MQPYVQCSVIYNSQDMEATKVSINWWINKGNVLYICIYIYTHTHTHTHTHTYIYIHTYVYIYTHTHTCIYIIVYYSAIKKNEIFCNLWQYRCT